MKLHSKLILATSLLLLLVSVSFAGAHEDAHGEADIVDTAIAADDFNTLVTAVKAAGLVDTLKSDGPFTVFAPTDAAFAALPEGTLDALLADKDKLTAVLTYHVVAQKVPSAAITGPLNVATVQGGELAVTTESGVQINDATVVQADIMTSNGVIHVIDKVLVPEGVL
ncbi:MAG: fasciclin domain-containing protein [Acidobacteriota bacterium]